MNNQQQAIGISGWLKKRLLIFFIFTLLLIAVNSWIVSQGFVLTQEAIVTFFFVFIFGLILFSVSSNTAGKKRLLIVGRIIFLLITIPTVLFIIINIPEIIKMHRSEQKTQNTLNRLNRLSQVGAYIPNQVTKEIGTVKPLTEKIYQVSWKSPETINNDVLYRYITIDTNQQRVNQTIYKTLSEIIYDIGTHLIYVSNNQLWIYNKTNQHGKPYPYLIYLDKQIVNENRYLTIVTLSDQYVLITERNPSKDQSQSKNYYILDKKTDNVIVKPKPEACLNNINCDIYFLKGFGEDTFLLSARSFKQVGQNCEGLDEQLLLFQAKKMNITKIDDFISCTFPRNQFLGVFNNDLVIAETNTQGFLLSLKNPQTGYSQIVLNEKDFPDKYPIYYYLPSEGKIFFNNGDSPVTFNLNTKQFEAWKASRPAEDANQPIINSAVVDSRTFEAENAHLFFVSVSENPLQITEIKNEDDQVYINTADGNRLELINAEISQVFENLNPSSSDISAMLGVYTIGKAYLVSSNSILFEIKRNVNQGYSSKDDFYIAEEEAANSSRIGLVELSSGKVYLVDQNRTESIYSYNDNDHLLITLNPLSLEGKRYRVLDLKNNLPLVNFAFGESTYSDPVSTYGPDLSIPTYQYLGLYYGSSDCMNPQNKRVPCTIPLYDLNIVPESVRWDGTTFSFEIVTASKEFDYEGKSADPSKVGNKAMITIDSHNNYKISKSK